MNKQLPKRILQLCDSIQRTYLNQSDQHRTVQQTIDKIRQQNSQFYKDAEVIYRDTQQIKQLKKQLKELDKGLKKLSQEILAQQAQEKKNSKWKWYDYPLAPAYAAWWVVKNTLKTLIYLCSFGFSNFFQSAAKAKQLKLKSKIDKQEWNKNQKQDAVKRLEVHVQSYAQNKGKQYAQFLRKLEKEFEKMRESTKQE